jgi:tetratricopeptide (TPR) repeat protein
VRSLIFSLAAICAVIAGLSFAAGSAERGLEAFRRRDFKGAESEFLKLTIDNPRSARAWKLLGMTYIAEEKYEEAENSCRKACDLDSREENACYYLGRVEYTLGRFERSLEAYKKALGNADDRPRALLGLAQTYEAMPSPAEAERYYKSAIESGAAHAKIDYGIFLFKQGRGAESLKVLRLAGAAREADRVQAELQRAPHGSDASGGAVRFEASELEMVVNNGAVGAYHLIETMIAGVAVFDYDGDGWPDIFVANGATIPSLAKSGSQFFNHLFRNNHDGKFTDVTQKAGLAGSGYSMGVAAGDYDNDGNVDLFVTGVNANTLYRNRGDGVFEDVTEKAGLDEKGKWAVAAGWFDYDNDGLLDLFVVRYVRWDPETELSCGFPEKGVRQYCNPKLYQPLENALYHNEGNGRFRDVSRESGIAAHPGKGMGVAFGDFDGDGRLDIFVTNDTMPNFLFHNRGDGTFEEVAVQTGVAYNADGVALSSMGADFRDYDNDGSDDLFVTALSNETFPLFRNVGGRFADVTYSSGIGKASYPWSGWGCGMFDFNNDGYKDLFTANGHVMDNEELTSSRKSRQPNAVWINQGNGAFRAQWLPGEAPHRGAAFGDFDRDGRIDAVVTRLNEKPIVLRNVTEGAGHWIELRLQGVRSNRDGIGARVHLRSKSGDQWNRVSTSVGYGGSSDRVAHFGLGADSIVSLLEVEWPSGARQTLRGLAADRFYEIKEPLN